MNGTSPDMMILEMLYSLTTSVVLRTLDTGLWPTGIYFKPLEEASIFEAYHKSKGSTRSRDIR